MTSFATEQQGNRPRVDIFRGEPGYPLLPEEACLRSRRGGERKRLRTFERATASLIAGGRPRCYRTAPGSSASSMNHSSQLVAVRRRRDLERVGDPRHEHEVLQRTFRSCFPHGLGLAAPCVIFLQHSSIPEILP